MKTTIADNVSLICQFNIDNGSTSIVNLINFAENLFLEFGYLVKKFYYSKEHKVFSPKYNKFKLTSMDCNYISGISFQSDFNNKDFEPNARLDIEINMRYIDSGNIVKLSVVINDNVLLDDIFNTYKTIIAVLAKNNNKLSLSGYSFLLPNYYGAVSFASGILRKMNMPCSLKNLASWYVSADLVNSTIGLMNCFSDLSEYQDQCLIDIFGKDNVFSINNVTALINPYAKNMNIADYIVSDNYNLICKELECKLPYKRLACHKER